jgi:site-specific DNA recombinase
LRPRRGKKTALPRQAKTGTRHKPKEEWIFIDVPPIVAQDVFDAAREQLARNQHFAKRNTNDEQYLLSGLTVCACCGYAFAGRTTHRRSDLVFRYYVCSGTENRRFPSGRVCSMSAVRADQLDGYVWQSVSDLLLNPERVLGEWSRRQSSDGATAELRARRDEAARNLASCEQNLKRLVDAYEAGAIELSDLKTRSDAVRARLQRAEREARETEHALNQTIEVRAIVTRLEDFAGRLRKGLSELSWQDRRDIVRVLVARVEIDASGATVVYRVPSLGGTGEGSPSGNASTGSHGGTGSTGSSQAAHGAEKASPGDESCRLRTRRQRSVHRGLLRSVSRVGRRG